MEDYFGCQLNSKVIVVHVIQIEFFKLKIQIIDNKTLVINIIRINVNKIFYYIEF